MKRVFFCGLLALISTESAFSIFPEQELSSHPPLVTKFGEIYQKSQNCSSPLQNILEKKEVSKEVVEAFPEGWYARPLRHHHIEIPNVFQIIMRPFPPHPGKSLEHTQGYIPRLPDADVSSTPYKSVSFALTGVTEEIVRKPITLRVRAIQQKELPALYTSRNFPDMLMLSDGSLIVIARPLRYHPIKNPFLWKLAWVINPDTFLDMYDLAIERLKHVVHSRGAQVAHAIPWTDTPHETEYLAYENQIISVLLRGAKKKNDSAEDPTDTREVEGILMEIKQALKELYLQYHVPESLE